jgi:hypothetical protein
MKATCYTLPLRFFFVIPMDIDVALNPITCLYVAPYKIESIKNQQKSNL